MRRGLSPAHLSVLLLLSEQLEQGVRIMSLLLLILLVLLLVGAFPAWPHSRAWGYGPSGGLGVIVAVVLLIYLLGYI
jgi:hypothetical protein